MTKILNENRYACALCGGRCCQRMPGSCLPADFAENGIVTPENLAKHLASGFYKVDYWDGDPREGYWYGDPEEVNQGFYIRPAAVNDKTGIECASWGGQCVFWDSEVGCKLTYPDRPAECRALTPVKDFDCFLADDYMPDGVSGKQYAALMWLPLHGVIREAIKQAERVRRGCAARLILCA